ncbi:Transmembrane protein C17orf113 [Nymphon striatum]|nr:Transmembrane protein C17orf113 [Nymphon striatum]
MEPLQSLQTNTDVFGSTIDPHANSFLFSLQEPFENTESEQRFCQLLLLCISGVIEVLERQLDRYLVGDLSVPNDQLLKQTQSAPTHNMYAEEVMGLTDHQFRRARNATVGFIDGKVKCKKNKTMDWLSAKPNGIQEKIITYAIKVGRKIRVTRSAREVENQKLQDMRLRNKNQKIDRSTRLCIERKMKSVFEGKSIIDIEFSDLLESEANLAGDTKVQKRNRNALLNTLLELAPRPNKRVTLTGMAERKKQSALDAFFGSKASTSNASDSTDNASGTATSETCAKKPKLVRSFRSEWLSNYTWLRFDNSTGMKCEVCIAAKKTNPFTYGCTSYQNTTLTRHQSSKEHIEAIKITEMQKQFTVARQNLAQCVHVQDNSRTDGHVKQLRTVYMMAKRNCPLDIFSDLMQLQVNNGITNCDNFYKKHEVVEEMQECIYTVLDDDMTDAINTSPYYGVMLDETCDVTIEKKLAIYIRYLNPTTGQVHVSFAGNEHITDCTALGIENALIEFLHRKGILNENNDNISKCMGLGTDGASVMTGRLNGLGARLKRRNPKLTQVHCAAHRLNLASSQAGKAIPYMSEYHRHIGILYRYYKDSSVKYDKLRELQDILHGNRKQVKKPTSVRWLSIESAVTMILKSYDAILLSVENADAKKDPKAVALHRFMATSLFLLITALLADVLCVIGILSLTFQKDTVNLSVIRHCVESTKETIQTMRQGSRQVDEVLQALGNVPPVGQKTIYKNIDLTDNQPMRHRFTTIRDNYLGSLSDKLSERFPQDDMDILECLDIVLNPARCPDDVQNLAGYGTAQLDSILDHYGDTLNTDRAKNQFLMYKHYMKTYKGILRFDDFCKHLIRDHALTYPDFVILAEIASIIPVSSAPCERGFSVQNSIKTAVRNRLNPKNLNRLMFIKLQGPAPNDFDFGRAVRLFQAKQRRK